ncbi:MAG: acyl-CoA/acyl-ACP dehydrogenase [Thermoleophilia bacterium]|nr:acyl-CoA/acyl-ACP dehydrogenase [Thermoleophilia bacterium]
MRFDFTDDQQEIKRTAKEMLASRSTLELVRSAAESKAYDPDLWKELCDLGWPGVAISEEYGGGGLGVVELAGLLEEGGYALAGSPLLATTACGAAIQEAGSEQQRETWLPRLATGEATGTLAIAGELAPDAAEADVIVLIESDRSGARLLAGDQASVSAVETIDPTRRYGIVTAEESAGEEMPGDPEAALAIGALITSAELVGICQRSLDVTLEYVKDRKQFGRPVGSFQAVQHKCARMLFQTEAARSATYFAAWAADADRDRLIEGASLAKATASEAGVEVTGSAIQAHGGIGFTWEADIHWFFKRAQLDAAYLDGTKPHRRRLAALAARKVTSPA